MMKLLEEEELVNDEEMNDLISDSLRCKGCRRRRARRRRRSRRRQMADRNACPGCAYDLQPTHGYCRGTTALCNGGGNIVASCSNMYRRRRHYWDGGSVNDAQRRCSKDSKCVGYNLNNGRAQLLKGTISGIHRHGSYRCYKKN